MREVKQTLMSLPPNIRKSPKYRDLAIREIVALKPEQTMNPSTINKTLVRISTVFKWAVRQGYMERNPAEGMQIPSKRREDQERDALTTEDIKTIFDHPQYGKGPSYTYWVPLIGLYSGMRLEEICQLHLEDIREVDGVWVFDVNQKGDKRVKTKSSERLVPVHSRLIELGLLEYVEKLRAQGQERLFLNSGEDETGTVRRCPNGLAGTGNGSDSQG
jgi:integrase